jgi:DNA-directed RNA polymerase specialized sigma24 family protein
LKTPVELAYEKHNQWVEIVQTFGGLNREECEDLVQTMYILLIKNTQKGIDYLYKDEINYYYVFKILRGLYVDLIRKKSKVKLISLENIEPVTEIDHNNYDEIYNKLQDILKDMYWYDKKVFEIIEDGTNISELSRKSKISYYSLYNTYKKVKQKLKDNL